MLGRTIGNYRITALLGRGGMGEVFAAEHQSRPGIRVAVKLLLADISGHRPIVERFFNEANAVSLIKHAGIVRIFDLGYVDERAYLIMELLEGTSLSEALRKHGAVPTAHMIDFSRQTASAVDAAHAAGIIHRDLKPDNLFLVDDHELASGKRVKVLDFGIAKLGDTRTHSGHTVGAMGTPAYMPPEQWKNAADVDYRSDVYSLGCLMFEMITGRPPFIGQSLPEYCTQHLTSPPPSPRAINRTLPPDLDALVIAMMAKDPVRRIQSMHLVDDALAAIQTKRGLKIVVEKRRASDGGVRAQTPPPTVPPPMGAQTTLGAASGQTIQPARSSMLGVWLGLGAGAAVGVAVVLVVTSKSGSSSAPSGPSGAASGAAKVTSGSGAAPTAKHGLGEIASRASAHLPDAAAERNRWIAIAPPTSPVMLGVDDAAAAAGALGFRRARRVEAPTARFEIQQHEVTWAELGRPAPDGAGDDFPATSVSWKDAAAYCASLGGALPGEAQLEYAARGVELRPHAWGGDAVDPDAIHAYLGGGATPARVMARDADRTSSDPATAIYDLGGNVQEWTADPWTEDDSSAPPAWASEGGRVHVAIRGIPLAVDPPSSLPAISAAMRDPLCADGACPAGTDQAMQNVGFRCVRPAR
jgi:serine/threonine-protein kinase